MKNIEKQPFISILIPILNEVHYIKNTIESVLAQDYPKELIEIIILDGMSNDGTRKIIKNFSSIHKRIKLIDNTNRIVSTALNLGIKKSKGDIIIRIDGHCVINNDFISRNVEVFNKYPEVVCTGGPINHQGKSNIGKAIALAMGHPLGIGNARHRYKNYEGLAEGAWNPAFRANIFDKVGYFDEDFIRNQDDEINYHINQAGGLIYLSQKIKIKYFVREKYKQLFNQYLQYGFWRIPFLLKHKKPASIRQIIPSIFFLLCSLLFITGFYYKSLFLMITLPLIYILVLWLVSLTMLLNEKVKVIKHFPLAIFLMHFGYALGFYYGIYKINSWKKNKKMRNISR